MRHVDRATSFNDGKSMSINLDVHKTSTYGRYGFLHMDVHTFRLLEIYVSTVRSQYFEGLTKLETANQLVFGRFKNGVGTVQQSNINHWVQVAWRK
ncbi:hypothetical protein DPMN_018687 [Dreissena polymorpha]|uniref:Uncharacterized protein n=1 Tax=Dreissena polymorpha TaxID=45954 RepID=A0A9D4NJ88_DREPO|nr:hypothetical protein DPMN_018687 [Dreissena polymorpha]